MSLREICNNLGLGSECGACIQEAVQMIKKSKQTPKQETK